MAEIELAAVYIDALAGEDAAVWPVVINRDPSADEVAVPDDSLVIVDIIGDPADFVDVTATLVYLGGALAYEGASGTPFKPGFDGPSSVAAALDSGQGLRVTIDKTSSFTSLDLVTVRVVSDGLAALTPIDELKQFTVEDTDPPVLVAVVAVGQRSVQLEFNEAVQCPGASLPTFTAIGVPSVPLTSTAVDTSTVFATVLTDIEMTPDAAYEMDLSCIEDLAGNAASGSASFIGFRPTQPEGRSFKLREMVTQRLVGSNVVPDFGLMLDCLQDVVDLLLASADGLVDIHSPDRAPEVFIDLILFDLGNPFDFALDLTAKRKLVEVLVEMYRQGGTAEGIENAIQFFLGITAVVVPFNDLPGQAVLDESTLDEDFVLGPSAQRDLYTFDVEVSVALTEEQHSQILAIVAFMKPAHTHLHELVENVPPSIWVLGTSALGSTTVLS